MCAFVSLRLHHRFEVPVTLCITGIRVQLKLVIKRKQIHTSCFNDRRISTAKAFRSTEDDDMLLSTSSPLNTANSHNHSGSSSIRWSLSNWFTFYHRTHPTSGGNSERGDTSFQLEIRTVTETVQVWLQNRVLHRLESFGWTPRFRRMLHSGADSDWFRMMVFILRFPVRRLVATCWYHAYRHPAMSIVKV